MAVGRSIIETIEMLPSVMQEWIKSLVPIGECADIEIRRDCNTFVSYRGYRVNLPSSCLQLKVTIPPIEHHCMFVECNGGWMRVDEYGEIVYTGKNETKVEEQELNDNDAFDLMDSIRDELWK